MARKKVVQSEPRRAEATRSEAVPEEDAGLRLTMAQETSEPSSSDPMDRIGAVVSKGLDLAEASLSLGLRVVNDLGRISQQRMGSATVNAAGPNGQPVAPPEAPHAAAAAGQRAASPPEPQPAHSAPDPYVPTVANRLPLHPGCPVCVSFSINNDSTESPKHVALSVSELVGEARAYRIHQKQLQVDPCEAQIDRVDFDKFVIKGSIPADAPSDVYSGYLLISGDEPLQILLRLSVSDRETQQ